MKADPLATLGSFMDQLLSDKLKGIEMAGASGMQEGPECQRQDAEVELVGSSQEDYTDEGPEADEMDKPEGGAGPPTAEAAAQGASRTLLGLSRQWRCACLGACGCQQPPTSLSLRDIIKFQIQALSAEDRELLKTQLGPK